MTLEFRDRRSKDCAELGLAPGTSESPIRRSCELCFRSKLPLMKFPSHLEDLKEMERFVSGTVGERIWKDVINSSVPAPYTKNPGSHSCNTIVMDRSGNIATGTHTINSMPWGDYGMIVDGVSLNTAYETAGDAPPGERAMDGLNPTLVFKGDQPILATGFFSGALHPAAFQILLNLLDYDMSPQQALNAPRFGVVTFDVPSRHWSILLDDRYPESWVSGFSKKGISFSKPSGFNDTGMGMVVRIDAKSGVRTGSPTDLLSHAAVMVE